jgi:hypothetical protein
MKVTNCEGTMTAFSGIQFALPCGGICADSRLHARWMALTTSDQDEVHIASATQGPA